ncbi:hypothetical protein OH492_04205 [Vibrio chagasii]|nr:hypothetical protein [Vibrio chagasii]
MNLETLGILGLGAAFSIGTAGGVLMAKLLKPFLERGYQPTDWCRWYQRFQWQLVL